MRVRRTNRVYIPRIYVLMGGMLFAFLVLAVSLWRLQVANVSQFENRQQIQSLRRVRLPGIRGKIYDRNGLCLADNRPVYSIAVFLEEVRRAGPWSRTMDAVTNVMGQVAAVTGLTPGLTPKAIKDHINQRLPLPLILWNDIGPQAMARFTEAAHMIHGTDIYTQATRVYPYSPYTSHLLGYVGRADQKPDEGEERYSYYLPEMTGRAGLEKLFDQFLRGEAGGMLVQIDVTGYRHGELAHRKPKAGGDIQLTLDMEVQLLAHKALGEHKGAVVVLDPNNGDVLAMLSAPGFDANRFVPYISSKDWKTLSENPGIPLLNRAVAGVYPPGSTFKPLVGLAAATLNPAAISTVYDSPSIFRIGQRVVHTTGHGEVAMREALKVSANVYFFKTALACGPEPIVEQALAAGLGKKTGVEVDFEQPGIIPDQKWQQDNRTGWSDGDTCNLAIGQGYVAVTPIQMAMLTATIANGGYLYRPRLVQAYREPASETYVPNPSQRIGKMNWSEAALNTVRGGMHDVIMAEDGTGKRAAVEGFDFAGKTGTAEYGVKGEGAKHTWMIAFAPFDNPQYAIAMLVEDGDSGGGTVGPCLKILMEGLYEKMKREGRVSSKVQYPMLNTRAFNYSNIVTHPGLRPPLQRRGAFNHPPTGGVPDLSAVLSAVALAEAEALAKVEGRGGFFSPVPSTGGVPERRGGSLDLLRNDISIVKCSRCTITEKYFQTLETENGLLNIEHSAKREVRS
jgi:penicillin-binding protein 2